MEALTVCRACSGESSFVMGGVLISHAIKYYECSRCGYVQTEDPFWLEEAYSSAINDSDTGIIARNKANTYLVLGTLFALGCLRGQVADFAGGYGLLVRMLRDAGVNALWSDRYCDNLFAKGFEYVGGPVDLVTSFEAFEHFVNPAEELDKMLSFGGSILLSTEIIPSPTPAQDDWWYYGKEHGQHIGFFRVDTLTDLARRKGKFFLTDGRSYHLITDRKISAFRWKMACLAARFLSRVFTYKLKSKIWSDHEFMAKRR